MNRKQKSGHAKRKARQASELKVASLHPKQLKLDFFLKKSNDTPSSATTKSKQEAAGSSVQVNQIREPAEVDNVQQHDFTPPSPTPPSTTGSEHNVETQSCDVFSDTEDVELAGECLILPEVVTSSPASCANTACTTSNNNNTESAGEPSSSLCLSDDTQQLLHKDDKSGDESTGDHAHTEPYSEADNESDFSGEESSIDSEREEDDHHLGNIDDLLAASYFTPPRKNETVAAKLTFIKKHPILPPESTKTPFSLDRVRWKTLPDGTKVERRWLSYNSVTNKIHCSTCMAFGSEKSNTSFVEGVVVNIKNIYGRVEKHELSKEHNDCLKTLNVCRKQETLDPLFREQEIKQKELNRLIVSRVIDIVITLATQHISFRGKRSENVSGILDDLFTTNRGNFLAIVKLVARYDPVLQSHLESCSRKSKEHFKKTKKMGNYTTFLSKTTLNRVVNLIATMIQEQISKEVCEGVIYSLEADSCLDTSVQEQLAMCLRYVFRGEVYERLVKLMNLDSTTGEAQYLTIKKELSDLGISLEHLASCSFDGAANLSGIYKGLQAFLKLLSKNSVYTHCYAHRLNLVISDTVKCSLCAQDFLNLLNLTAVFASESYKRVNLWKRLMSSEEGAEKLRRPQKIGATRWNSADIALNSIMHTTDVPHADRSRYIHLIEYLHLLGYSATVDSKTQSEARNLLNKWTEFSTILTAFLFMNIFEATTPVSKYLQTKGLDYIAAYSKVDVLHKKMVLLSNNFEKVLAQATSFSEVMNGKLFHLQNAVIQDCLPEVRVRRVRVMPGELCRDEAANFTPLERYKVQNFITVMDKIKMSLEQRFINNKEVYISCSYLDPGRFDDISSGKLIVVPNDLDFIATNSGVNKEDLLSELKNFAANFRSLQNSECINVTHNPHQDTDPTPDSDMEISDEEESVVIESDKNSRDNCCSATCSCISCAFKLLYRYNLHTASYTNLYVSYKYILTLSCTQVNCERAFSKLKIIKNRLRSSMSQDLLEALMIISCERDLIPSIPLILDRLSTSSNFFKRMLC